MVLQEQELPYCLQMWDDQDAYVEELIRAGGGSCCSSGAFAEALRPGTIITLRQKSRVLADSRR
jgi:hypothetical protein